MEEMVIEGVSGSSAPQRAGLPLTSLIICSRNRPQLLFECIHSILQGEELPTELCIIDQSDAPHSSLPSLKTDRPCDIRYLWTQSVGLSRARNAGVAAAQHDIFVFTDDDMIMPVSWFRSLIRALLDVGPRAVVTGQVLLGAVEEPGGFAPSLKADEVPATYQGRVGKDVLWAGNMAMYRSAIEEVGDFDERLGAGGQFPGAEDNDFGLRLLEAGYRISYVPQAVAYHRAWRPKSDCVPLYWSYGRGQGAYYAKYLSFQDRYMLQRMIGDILHHLANAPRRVWQRQPHRLLSDAAYVFGLLSGAAEWLWTQRKTR
jgi:GT2 family glycosyltransferase